MTYLLDTAIRLTVPANGAVVLPSDQLQQLGFVPGDQLVILVNQPGQVYLQKVEVSPPSKAVLQQQIQQAFQKSGYDNREKVLQLIRDVKREIADERATSAT